MPNRQETRDTDSTNSGATMLFCLRNGDPAPRPGCTCDACLWVAALEEDFRNEEEHDGRDERDVD